MNSFTVDWTPAAEDELADIWLQATDRNAVTAAQAALEKRLEQDPTGYGQHHSEGLYSITVPPLHAFYSIDFARQFVQVTDVREVP
jgi:hypothetical protein